MNIEDLKSRVKSGGYKITPQRKAILTVLLEHRGCFISVEKICEETRKIHPEINITTVYRNLDIFENLHIVHKIFIDEGVSRYDIISVDAHHHHIICKGCGKTEVIEFCPLGDLVGLAEEKKFTLTGHKIELYGFCDKCKKKNDGAGK